MDPFQAFSPEILLNILLSCDTIQGASSLSMSSPAAFAVWVRYWHLITRDFVQRAGANINNQLQDYMALILFPIGANISPFLKDMPHEDMPFNVTETDYYHASKQAQVEAVEAHLDRWGKGNLPNPFESRNTRAVIDLLNLHLRLRLYIEDFLGKATHPWPRRSYRYIPHWAHTDFSHGFSNQLLAKSVCNQNYDMDANLTDAQRLRVYRGFLRHELLCKIYSPQRGETLVPVVRPPVVKARYKGCRCEDETMDCARCRHKWHLEDWFDPADPFRHWDWNILGKYEGSPTTLGDKRLFVMIREYVTNIYVALMQNEIQEPIEPQAIIMPGASLENWGQVPLSHLTLSLDSHMGTVGRSLSHAELQSRLKNLGVGRYHDFDTRLEFATSAGFDVLTAVLLGSRDDLCDLFRTLGKELSTAEPNEDTTNIIHSLNAPCEECGIYGSSTSERGIVRKLTAWPVFNNPAEPEPVDRSETLIAVEGARFDNRPEAYCAHSSTCGMTGCEDIIHSGGFAVYPSLSSKMVPFWRQAK